MLPRIILVLLLCIACLGCTERNTIIQPLPITDTVKLHGVLYAWKCGIHDFWNNPPSDTASILRFGVFTHESANITLIRDNGFTSYFTTDTLSEFLRYVSAGTYMAIVSTGYTYPPDTITNIHLVPGDTTLRLDIMYDVLEPEHVTFEFIYPSANDTMGAKAELDKLLSLNSAVFHHADSLGWRYRPGPLYLFSYFPPDTFRVRTYISHGICAVDYRVPIIRNDFMDYPDNLWNVVEVSDLLNTIKNQDTQHRFDNLYMYPSGIYICLD